MRVAIYTLGCKVNQYETAAMEQELQRRGHTLTDFESEADVYIINTCSVTAVSDKKSRQMIRRAKKRNSEAVVAACGCYVQTHHSCAWDTYTHAVLEDVAADLNLQLVHVRHLPADIQTDILVCYNFHRLCNCEGNSNRLGAAKGRLNFFTDQFNDLSFACGHFLKNSKVILISLYISSSL